MASTTSSVGPRPDTFWRNGRLMEIKARAAAIGGVLEGRFFEKGYGPPLHVHGVVRRGDATVSEPDG